MNEHNDRPLDEPHPSTKDRPVAGWPGHDADHRNDDTDERRNETPADEEPLVGEVWNEGSAAEPAGTHAANAAGPGSAWPGEKDEHGPDEPAGEPRHLPDVEDTERSDGHHVGEPFGTEEPMIVSEPAAEKADAVAEPLEAETTEAEPVVRAESGEPESEAATATAAEAEPVVDGARPTAADDFTIDRLFHPEAAERFRDRWRDVKAVFVDDPSDAVRQASALSGDAVDELTTVLARLRENLDGHWDEGRETDTERLRVALRGYGSLIDRILTR
jgi:hypothetical protein